ncbi:hypothetical protein OF83DRAFT_724279 [Amylostereum chailletii]|nr:hypothetical protein OF83DRAFT_724279 [Amylostereum chailletii]
MQGSESGSDSARSSVDSQRAVASFHVPPVGVSDAHPARMALFPRICPVSAAADALSSPSTGERIKGPLSAGAGAAASPQSDARDRTSCSPPHAIKLSSTNWLSHDPHGPPPAHSPAASSPPNTPSPPPSLSSSISTSSAAAPPAPFRNAHTQRSAPPIAVKVERASSPPLDASTDHLSVRSSSSTKPAHLRPYPTTIPSPSPTSGLGSPPRPADSDWDSEAVDELDPRLTRRHWSFASAPALSTPSTSFTSTSSAPLPTRGTKRARNASESPPKSHSGTSRPPPANASHLPPSPSSSSRPSSTGPSQGRVPIHTRRNAAPPDPAGVAVCRWKGCGVRFTRATQPTDLTTDVSPVVPVPVPASGRRRHCVPMDPTQAEILAHLKRVHGVDVNSQTKLQTCCWDGCDARLVAKSFARHILGGHLRMMDHVCAVCGKSFSRKDSMTRHIAACIPPGQGTEGRRRGGRGRVMRRKAMAEVEVKVEDEEEEDELDELSPLSELSSGESESGRGKGDGGKAFGSRLVGAIFSSRLSSAETLFKPSILRAARWSSEESLQTEKDVCL